MGEDQGQVGAQLAKEQKSPEELRREIMETRAELGDTAAALAEKADFKARAREKVGSLKRTAAEKRAAFAANESGHSPDVNGLAAQAGSTTTQAKATAQENPVLSAAACAFIGGFILGRITR